MESYWGHILAAGRQTAAAFTPVLRLTLSLEVGLLEGGGGGEEEACLI